MQFHRNKYLLARQDVINLIKQTHNWENDEGFIADGIICLDTYEKQELKILVILAESYGYSHSGMIDIEEQPKEDIMGVGNPTVKTPKKVAALLWLLFKSFQLGRKIDYNEFPKLLQKRDGNYAELQSVLSRIAWINVKKASKIIDDEDNITTRLDYMEIYNACKRNRELLDIQIQSIQANLVLIFSDPVIHSLYDNKLLGVDRNSNKIPGEHLTGYSNVYLTFLLIF